MRITILKGQDPRHNFFAQSIVAITNIETLVMTHKRANTQRLKKMLFKSPKTFFTRVSKYLFYYFMKWNHKERAFFGTNTLKTEQIVHNYNDPKTIEKIRQFNPDLIAVFGTPIISKEILNIPQYGAINLHGGISPEYKGGNTIFWALFNNELEKVGATIHFMVEKVDSGAILAKVYPELNETDSEFTASAKTFQEATKEFVHIIKWIQEYHQKPQGKEQLHKGTLYRAKDRTVIRELQGLIKIPNHLKKSHLPNRVERFYA